MVVAEKIRNGIEAGFINYKHPAEECYLPKILTNSVRKQTKVLDSILSELEQCSEFAFSVAFITNSGVACLIDTLKILEKKGIRGRILASQYQNFTEPRALKRLLALTNIEIKIITDENFHAKGYLFQRKVQKDEEEKEEFTIIVGSSNLTQNALSRNNEWNVKLSAAQDGFLPIQMYSEFNEVFSRATAITPDWLAAYEELYVSLREQKKKVEWNLVPFTKVNPNAMQVEALKGIAKLRSEGKNKGLLISATGTGKTYLSAFDVRRMQPKKFLFVVHREIIASEAKRSFEKVLGPEKIMGMYTGNNKTKVPYLFSTIQTLARDENLYCFEKEEFDYIVIDEVHRSGAESYKKVLDYFKPKFLLGMTATPERTDGVDVFSQFDHNIAYEIRLHQALAENMLIPFHYHGVRDIEIDGEVINETTSFNKLVMAERVEHILNYAEFYGCDDGRVKGLVFCSRVEEAIKLSEEFNKRGYQTLALSSISTDEERKKAIERLEADDAAREEQLDYIFTRDIFNEGVDIPSINQIIMLRPTESAIIFVQQLGRGLRKSAGKKYLEVIDFIGNYSNNFMLPIALYGEKSYNKDLIRKQITTNYIPGASTIYFDEITQQRIFETLAKANLSLAKALKKDYDLLRFQLGRAPKMMDFVHLGGRDPYTYLKSQASYYEYVCKMEGVTPSLSEEGLKSLRFFNKEVCNGKRLEEILLIAGLIENDSISYAEIKNQMVFEFGIYTNEQVLAGVENYLNRGFFTTAERKKYGDAHYIIRNGETFTCTAFLKELLQEKIYQEYLLDMLNYAWSSFKSMLEPKFYREGFQLYQKYSRKDVCRILCWEKDESATVYGYRIKYNTCPIFVTYKKSETIADSTKYKDRFLNKEEFSWMTRNNVQLESKEVLAIKNENLRIPLFIKQSDGEGSDFYYLGDIKPKKIQQSIIVNNEGKELPIVNIIYKLQDFVDDKLYKYFEKSCF